MGLRLDIWHLQRLRMVSTGSPVRIRPSALPLRSPSSDPIPSTASSPARSCSFCQRLSVFVRRLEAAEPQ